MTKTYLQFRRALRQYYRNETTKQRDHILGPRFRTFWQRQHQRWAAGERGIDIADATCVVMLS